MNIIILTTGGGNRFARKIISSINWQCVHRFRNRIRINSYKESVFNIERLFSDNNFSTNDTIIHARAAHPNCTWMAQLEELERDGFKVINSTEVLKLTSNKLNCSMKLQDHFPHPRTWEIRKRDFVIQQIPRESGEYILKPETSMSQGEHVRKINFPITETEFISELNQVPGNKIVLQECVPYTALYRVIVIGGVALPYSFVDKPEENRWRVSVCLNRNTMRFVSNPDRELLRLAENIQSFIGGDINFIDIFGTRNGYVISEINTACSLNIHENLAKRFGREDWNIHYRIAKHLVNKLLEIV